MEYTKLGYCLQFDHENCKVPKYYTRIDILRNTNIIPNTQSKELH